MQEMTRGRWRLAVCAALLLIVPGLTACTPAPSVVVAVRMDGGKPVAVLAPCDKLAPDDISLRPLDASSGPVWSIRRESGPALKSVELLGDAPSGWTARETTLGRLEPGVKYLLLVAHHDRFAASPIFTEEQLTGLRPGQVVAAYSDMDQSRVVTEKEFAEHAADSC